jgi:uncharacterized protein
MTMTRSVLALAALTAGLAACSGAPATRFLVDSTPAAAAPVAPQRVRVRTIELREVVLPTYGEGTQILRQGADGGLVPVPDGQWADGSPAAVTAELARSLDLRSTATVAAEPWPLVDPAQVRLEVRFERVLARADGQFQLAGQFAVSSPDMVLRDFIQRFDIETPLPPDQPGAQGVALAYGRALSALSDQIIARLAR